MKWAINKAGNLEHVSSAERGAACENTCLSCGEDVLARKGDIRDHHYSHVSDRADCPVDSESVLHLYAKQVLAEAKGFMVPDEIGSDPKPLWLDLSDIRLEVWQDGIRPDVIGTVNGVDILIEMAVTSFVGLEKRAIIVDRGAVCLQIDLSKFHRLDFDPAAVKEAVVESIAEKAWIVPMEVATAAPVIEVSPLQKAISSAVEKVKPVEERVKVYGTALWIKRWPDGGLDIRTPYYNPALSAAMRIIRHQFGGRWVGNSKVSRFGPFCAEAVIQEIRLLPSSWNSI